MVSFLSAAFAWFVANANLLNFLVAFGIFAGAVALLLIKPSLLGRPFAAHALDFWLLQWLVFLVIYLWLYFNPTPSPIALLILIDVQSVFAVGFFMAFLHGEAYKAGPVWRYLIILPHYHVYIRMMIDGKPAKPFSARVL